MSWGSDRSKALTRSRQELKPTRARQGRCPVFFIDSTSWTGSQSLRCLLPSHPALCLAEQEILGMCWKCLLRPVN